ncbi:uncharacterized protein LOC135481403 [Liolophura sinensis]|uniref:uncharacterized protein LOC135481403 n=1 Tax=Liolophura sinensis TaxID=3198878 RepID=UPI0031580007
MYSRISLNVLKSVQRRNTFVCINQFSTSLCQYGRKSRVPFDKRFPVTGRHLSARVKGGSQELALRLSVHNAHRPGYTDKRSLQFRVVPEMVPEFIVPDLTDFELKPYVSYRVPEVTQSKLTARNLFDACYAEKLAESHRSGKLTKEEVERILQLKPTK